MVSKNWEGVYARASSIRVTFVYNGVKHFETLSLPPTPANMKYADSVRKEILRRIELGTFTFSEFFPKSKHAKQEKQTADRLTFRHIAQLWLETKKRSIAKTTLRHYEITVDTHFNKLFGDKPMADITFKEISKYFSDLEVENKTYNNILSVLRGIYQHAVDLEVVTINQAAKLKFTKKKKPEPDPLTYHEIQLVLDDMREHYPEQIEIYFNLAFRIGFRPSEGIDLRWANVDWNKGELLINSAKVQSITKDTKTHKDRIVELDDECLRLLQRQRKHTYMVGEHIFTYPGTNRPHPDTSNLVQKYWRPSLKRCKIRDRDARQTRHTCATLMLMAGCQYAWAAAQLGHSVQMFLNEYSRWINGEDQGKERSKMSAVFNVNDNKNTIQENAS